MKKFYLLFMAMCIAVFSFGQISNATKEEKQIYLDNLNKKSVSLKSMEVVSLKSAVAVGSDEVMFNHTGDFQIFTIPSGVISVNIEAYGAQGASGDPSYVGGNGAKMNGDFAVSSGDQLIIAVGGMGQGQSSDSNGGGGGGTFVVLNNPVGTYTFTGGSHVGASFDPLIIAGGGGGTRASVLQNGNPGVVTQNGTTGSGSSETGGGATNTSTLGFGGLALSISWGSAGGGLVGDGVNDYSYGNGGSSFINGAAGGTGGTGSGDNAAGGFGSGGQGRGSYGGGGGGGYTGGDGGRVAGGGGSYNAGTNQYNLAGANVGDGWVRISWEYICLNDMVVDNDPGECGAVVTYTQPALWVGATVTQLDTSGLTSGDLFPVGVTTQSYKLVWDGGGVPVAIAEKSASIDVAIDTCTFTITVNDVEDPVVNCWGDIVVDNDLGECGTVVNFGLSSGIVNGSFETGDYTGWTLYCSDSSNGTFGILAAGQEILTGGLLYDYFAGINKTQSSSGLPYVGNPTDGNYQAVLLETGPATHRMYQDVTLPSGNPQLNFDLQYKCHTALDPSNEYIAIYLRDVSTDAVLDTLFKTLPGNPTEIPMTSMSLDISAFAGQNVRIDIVLHLTH